MQANIDALVQSCSVCQKNRSLRNHASELYSTAAKYPFQAVFMDYIGQLTESNGYKYILVIIDRFSRFVELIPIEATTAKSTCAAFYNEWICAHGVPVQLSTDGGSHFNNSTMKELCRLLDVSYHVTTAYHPESHGVVERMNYVVMQSIRAIMADTESEWSEILGPVKFAINTSVNRSTGLTPFEVVHGFPARLTLHNELGIVLQTDDDALDFARELSAKSLEIRDQVVSSDQQAFKTARDQFLKKSSSQVSFEVNDFVLVHFERLNKLAMEWKGPYVIKEKINDVIYTVQDITNNHVSRVHVNRIHAFYPGKMTEQQLKAEALKSGEYYIDRVYEHVVDGANTIWLRVKWT